MATRWDKTPGTNDDVVARSKEDAGKVKKAWNVDDSDLKGGAKDSVKAAGVRAATRLAGRAGYAGAALQGGYEVGRAIDEATGVGKKLVDKSGLGEAVDKAVNSRDRVELSQSAKDRIAKGELDEQPKASTSSDERSQEPSINVKGKLRSGRNEEIDDDTREAAGGYKKGGGVRGWGKARGARKAKIY
jgi:hypothetical protein